MCQTLQLIDAISTTLYEVTEPTVAEKKIHWWHEELARMASQTARHPACVAVQSYLHRPDAVNACVSILSAAATERYTPPATDNELDEMISADYGARLKLVERTLSEHIQPCSQHELALGLGHTHRLASLSQRLQHGYAVFSDERFTQFQTTPEQLLKAEHDDNTLVASAVEQTSQTWVRAIDEFSRTEKSSHASLPVIVTAYLRQSQVNLWRKRRPNLQREYVTITPIRKFLIAYRCKRRFA